jgi:hypothetical protein
MKKVLSLLLAILPMLAFVSCSKDESGVTLNKSEVELYQKETFQLEVKGSDEKPKYSTENNLIASVDENGKVTGWVRGSTTILVNVGNTTLRCKVNVKTKLNFLPDPYLGFGEDYAKVKENAQKDMASTITDVREIDNAINVVRVIDGVEYDYIYSFKDAKLDHCMIALNIVRWPNKFEPLADFIAERFYVVRELSDDKKVGLISTDKKTLVTMFIDRGLSIVMFAPLKSKDVAQQ